MTARAKCSGVAAGAEVIVPMSSTSCRRSVKERKGSCAHGAALKTYFSVAGSRRVRACCGMLQYPNHGAASALA